MCDFIDVPLFPVTLFNISVSYLLQSWQVNLGIVSKFHF